MSLAPAIASAATVGVSGGTLTFNAGTGVDNRVAVSFAVATFTVTDLAEGTTAQGGCAGGGGPGVAATCSSVGVTSVVVNTGDGSDRIDGSAAGAVGVAITLNGGSEGDHLSGSAESDTLNGDGGDDTLLGNGGADALNAGPGFGDLKGGDGMDTLTCGDGGCVLDGGEDADVFNGGADFDLAVYADRTADLNVSLDGSPNDGAGEGDNVGMAVEGVIGGSGDDQLTGNIFENVLDGADGADVLDAGAAGDLVVGGGGADVLNAGAGDDGLGGGEGGDTLDGGDGDDSFDGEAGNDLMHGGLGDDFFSEGSVVDGDIITADTPNGADLLDGGPGNDEADYQRSASLRISLDGFANDGALGEGDNVFTEQVFAGFGRDVLIGNNANNVLDAGLGGRDTVLALGGDDKLVAGGRSKLKGGAGKDKLDSRNGRKDKVNCGKGRDFALAEKNDKMSGCERVKLSRRESSREPVPIG